MATDAGQETESSGSPCLTWLAPRGLLSFAPDFAGLEFRSLNVLIGPNGAGKSNFVSVLDLLRLLASEAGLSGGLPGGSASWVHAGQRGVDPEIALRVGWQEDPLENPDILRHSTLFALDQYQLNVVREQISSESNPDLWLKREKNSLEFSEAASGGVVPRQFHVSEGTLAQIPVSESTFTQRSVVGYFSSHSPWPDPSRIKSLYGTIAIYRDWQIGRRSPLRAPQPADARNDVLAEDFSNLGLFLSRLRRDPAVRRKMVGLVQTLYDGITDFDVFVEGGTVQVFLFEGDKAIPASRLSDGTLRFLALLALLCDPKPPGLICLEEPELGLHPDVISTLAALLVEASARTQLVVTTHSDLLISALGDHPESVVVCEKVDGGTRAQRLNAESLAPWLEGYRLGDVWLKGEIGGTRW